MRCLRDVSLYLKAAPAVRQFQRHGEAVQMIRYTTTRHQRYVTKTEQRRDLTLLVKYFGPFHGRSGFTADNFTPAVDRRRMATNLTIMHRRGMLRLVQAGVAGRGGKLSRFKIKC